ncbi:MAG TPA: hypothetical protein VFP68_12720 [Burkholderiaceae bacterium]|nr:hypothetical protein [Burkholderiaceae bacterium]
MTEGTEHGPARANAWKAPGRDIPTTVPAGRWDLASGSSFAAAHVAGLMALLRERQRAAPASAMLVRSPYVEFNGGHPLASRWRSIAHAGVFHGLNRPSPKAKGRELQLSWVAAQRNTPRAPLSEWLHQSLFGQTQHTWVLRLSLFF